jgi:hypothetical protein
MNAGTERYVRRWLAPAAMVLILGLIGCAHTEGNEMNSDKAREQLRVAAEAAQSATGADWEPMTAVGPIDCSPGLERMKASWKGVATVDRDAGYAAVREALEEVGFETRILGPNSTTPAVASQTVDGFGLDFAYPTEGGPLYLYVSSDCFPLEEWPDEEG